MSAAALAAAVQIRVSVEWLTQITNDNPSLTSINTARLEAACQDAIGVFERVAGLTHDTANATHLPILVEGALYFLEKYKSRESAMANAHMKSFIAACKDFKSLGWVPPTSTSNLVPTREKAGSRPDMDRSKKLWQQSGYTIMPQETFSE